MMKICIRIVLACCVALLCTLALPISAGAPATAVDETAAPAESDPAGEAVPDAGAVGHSVPVIPYMQNDPAWAGYLYGGQDPMAAYGCGPTVLAIAVASLTDTPVTPVDTAAWAAANGYFSPGHGSVHGLIPDGARNYGLKVENLSSPTPDTFRLILSMDKLIVLLMGPGDFSDAGHFIVAYGYDGSGNILVSDPASPQRCATAWPAETIIAQLMYTAKNGGPVWIVSKL